MFSTAKWYLWAALAAAIVLGLVVWNKRTYSAGQAEVQAKWNASIERGKAEVARLKAEAGKITTVTEIQYVNKVERIREKGQTIIKTVEVFVPTDSGFLDGGFRVFHDAAANNTIPNPAEIATAAATPITDVARTVAINYENCHVAYAAVNDWQKWAEQQCALNKGGCPDGQ